MAFRSANVLMRLEERAMTSKGQGPVKQVFTITGGSGMEKADLAQSFEEVRNKNLALYHRCLSKLQWIRETYGVPYSTNEIKDTIRDLFEQYRDVKTLEIASILNFKGKLEFDEVEKVYKGPHDISRKIREYEERLLKASLADKNNMPSMQTTLLSKWKDLGVIPQEIVSWEQYEQWIGERDKKFETFATDAGIFTEEDLELNKKEAGSRGCMIM